MDLDTPRSIIEYLRNTINSRLHISFTKNTAPEVKQRCGKTITLNKEKKDVNSMSTQAQPATRNKKGKKKTKTIRVNHTVNTHLK